MAKPKITRTYGPIHFEDLDPHRFEDLVRELIYDHKDWQTIEATGRSGNDGGFDIRAYEKTGTSAQNDYGEDDDTVEVTYPMDGNLWMIQGKREKALGPKRIKEILTDVDAKNPPYGYILAASANFSKDSYDVFREELRKKGVMEFYLWGKAELEDMLHFPKNDRLLFAFFGISLVSRRRSRATEIRQIITNKNKLFRILSDSERSYQSVLLRDSKDSEYPFKSEYKDFDKLPRWREYKFSEFHPNGIVVNSRRHYAYVDTEKKEYDYAEASNLIHLDSDAEEKKTEQREINNKVEHYWDHLPQRNQVTFIRNGLIRYDDMLVIDDKGDNWHKFPHIFVDFDWRTRPISGWFEYLEAKNEHVYLKEYKRVKKFPESFQEPSTGKVYEEKSITLSDEDFSMLKHSNDMFRKLYEYDGRYKYLKPKDIVRIANQDRDNNNSKHYLRITHKESLNLKDYVEKYPDSKWMIERQIGKDLDMEKTLNIFEFKRIYDFAVEREIEKGAKTDKIKRLDNSALQ